MFNIAVPIWELVVRAAVVYLFLVVLLRLTGKRQIGQHIREDGPATHVAKAGTPTMGGIAIVGSVVAGYAIGHIGTEIRFSRTGYLAIGAVVAFGTAGTAVVAGLGAAGGDGVVVFVAALGFASSVTRPGGTGGPIAGSFGAAVSGSSGAPVSLSARWRWISSSFLS